MEVGAENCQPICIAAAGARAVPTADTVFMGLTEGFVCALV